MSAIDSQFIALLILVGIASAFGSPHCSVMCGGLFLTAQSRSSGAKRPVSISRSVGYHCGRLLCYLTLGIIAGALGDRVLTGWFGSYLTSISALFFVGAGVGLFLDRKRGGWVAEFMHSRVGILHRCIYKMSPQGFKPLLLGILSGLLPCGWLHLYVVGAALLAHPLYSSLFLFAFWLGTVPIFHLLSGLTSFVTQKGVVGRRLAGGALVAYGILLAVARLTDFGHSMVGPFVAHGPQVVELGIRDFAEGGVSVDTFPLLCLPQAREEHAQSKAEQ